MNSMIAVAFLAAFAVANAAVIAPGYYAAPIYSSRLITSPYASVPLSTEVIGGAASEDTVIAGPSGTISTSKNVAGPSSATRYAPALSPVYTARYAPYVPYAYTYGGLYL
ncbi:uncharacterized protein LOC123680305 [Harmonia axyridis]|uniref:uncharacterized protein LOC123680305 n=1 Tax=Harmonia axyridis TaxID=115357 RepID=UPI001E277E91|nr:uncharacterized protein LOC123680305 [Harmonia axyridis]